LALPPITRHFQPFVPLSLVAFAALAAVACAASQTPEPTSTPGATPASDPVIQQPNRHFTPDDLVAAGWKKSKQLDAEALPAATEVWYGFHRKKDIEVRVYASHEDVLQYGVGPAEEAAAATYVGDHFKGVKPNYGAYMVVGNLVLLCELDIGDCQNLVANLD